MGYYKGQSNRSSIDGGAVSAAIGILSAFVNIPLGAEISMGLGVASAAGGRGETVQDKTRNATLGAVGGLGLSQGLAHVPISGGGAVEAGVGFLDDTLVMGATAAKTVGEVIRNKENPLNKNITRVAVRISRMTPRPKLAL